MEGQMNQRCSCAAHLAHNTSSPHAAAIADCSQASCLWSTLNVKVDLQVADLRVLQDRVQQLAAAYAAVVSSCANSTV